MKPLSPEMMACFKAKPTERPPGCEPLSFIVTGTGLVTADEAFANGRSIYRNQLPLEGPFGYELWEIGPDNARAELYRKIQDGRTLVYTCTIFDNHGKRDGVCDPVGDRLNAGGEIHFFSVLAI